MKNIVMLVYGTVPTDPRVRKTYLSLQKHDVYINLISFSFVKYSHIASNMRIYSQNEISQDSSGSSLSMVDLLKFWIFSILMLFKINDDQKIQYVHAHDFTTLIPAILLKLYSWNTVLIYDAHELAPEASKEFFSVLHMILAYLIEVISYPFIDVIISVSPLQTIVMRQRYNKLIRTVRNLPERAELENGEREIGERLLVKHGVPSNEDTVKFIYASHIAKNRGFEELLQVWEELKNEKPNYLLLLAGDGPYLDELLPTIERLQNVYYLGYFNVELYYSILLASDIGLCLIDPLSNLNNLVGYPNKITEYFAMNKFVISTKLLNFKHEVSAGNCVMLDSFTTDNLLQTIKFCTPKDHINTDQGELNETYLWENNNNVLAEIYDL